MENNLPNHQNANERELIVRVNADMSGVDEAMRKVADLAICLERAHALLDELSSKEVRVKIQTIIE